MLYVLKADPVEIDAEGLATVTVPAFFGGSEIAPGDECFLWLAEDRGGAGLTARGTVVAVTAQARRNRTIRFRVDQFVHSTRGVGALRPYRDRPETAAGMIARKLYRHAHNKVAAISEDEAAWLREAF